MIVVIDFKTKLIKKSNWYDIDEPKNVGRSSNIFAKSNGEE